jgi:hypothetical protein
LVGKVLQGEQMKVRKRDQQFRKVRGSKAWFGEHVNVVEEMQFDVTMGM